MKELRAVKSLPLKRLSNQMGSVRETDPPIYYSYVNLMRDFMKNIFTYSDVAI